MHCNQQIYFETFVCLILTTVVVVVPCVVIFIRLQSPCLSRHEKPALGAPGLYINWKTTPALDAERERGTRNIAEVCSMTSLRPIACKLAAVHREGGEDPYFTIAMDHTGDTAVAHELQVEWPK